MNCHICLSIPRTMSRCDAYPQGWPACGGYISANGTAKVEDDRNPEKERQQQQTEYLANLERMGWINLD